MWLLPGGGACMVAPGGVHAWLLQGVHGFCGTVHGFCWGGMRGFCWGACMVFARGACVVFARGACMVFAGRRVWFLPGGHV